MPFAFQLIDDYWQENKLIGLKLFICVFKKAKDNSISKNLMGAIFDQLKGSIVYRELEVVALLFPLLLMVYFKLDIPSSDKMSQSFFKDLLSEMERSCTAAFRKVC